MNPFVLALAIVAVIAIAEIVISARWNRAYFTTGIPIFISRVETPALENIPFEHLQKGSAAAAGPQLVFRRLDSDAIAFRESSVIHYAPLMRGCIRRDSVVGYLNWFVFALLVALAVTMGKHIVNVALYIGAAMALLYLIQGVRFWRLARALRALPASA